MAKKNREWIVIGSPQADHESVAVTEKTVDLSDGDEDENILTFDDIEGGKLPDEEAKP